MIGSTAVSFMDKSPTRRAFFGMGAAAFAAGTVTAAQARFLRWEKGEHIRVGLVMGEWSHTENCWAKLINGLRGENNKPHFIKRTSPALRGACAGQDRSEATDPPIEWRTTIRRPLV